MFAAEAWGCSVDLFEAMRTTRAMRRLDPGRDVTATDLRRILEAAGSAASGGNLQPLRWLVVRQPSLRRALGDLYREISHQLAGPSAGAPPVDDRSPHARMQRSMQHLVEHFGDAPVVILACASGELGRVEASVFPAVQNLMLAARACGLGTTLTTRLRLREDAVRVLLGIPDEVHVFAAIPVGYPRGTWGAAPRRPIEEVSYLDRWGESLDL